MKGTSIGRCCSKRTATDRVGVTEAVAAAFTSLGLTWILARKATCSSTGRRWSGAAYLHRRDRVLHHGTLLCRADWRTFTAFWVPREIWSNGSEWLPARACGQP